MFDKLEQIGIEIYNKGLTDGKKGAYSLENMKQQSESNYQRGLDDAWKCARKIYGMDKDTRMSAFVFNEYETVLDNYSAASAIKAIKEWEEKQTKKNCMNCGHMRPHYDTFRCNVIGKCLRREKWIPKREDVKKLPYSDYPKPLTVTMELSSADVMVLEEIVGEKVETEEQAVHALKVAMVLTD